MYVLTGFTSDDSNSDQSMHFRLKSVVLNFKLPILSVNTACFSGFYSDVKNFEIYGNNRLLLAVFVLLSVKPTCQFFFVLFTIIIVKSFLSHIITFSSQPLLMAVIYLFNVYLNVLHCQGYFLLFICMTRSDRHSCHQATKMAFSTNSCTYSKRKWNAHLVSD